MPPQSSDYRVDAETMAGLESIVEDSEVDTAREIFAALSEERRLLIMRLLDESELCVCDLVEVFDVEYSKLSYHLKVLKDAGLVRADRDGNFVTYQATECGQDVIDVISRFL